MNWISTQERAPEAPCFLAYRNLQGDRLPSGNRKNYEIAYSILTITLESGELLYYSNAMASFIKKMNEEAEGENITLTRDNCAIAWAPLPEPYKEPKTMRVMRTVETETDKLQVGDTIELLHGFTATCQEVTEQGAVMLFDQYVDERCINEDDTNEEGFEQSDLCGFLLDNIDQWIPNELLDRLGEFEGIGTIRLPYLGEMVEELPEWAEKDGKKLWPLMANKRNRIAFYQDGRGDRCWCMNKVKISAADFCYVNFSGYANASSASYSNGVRPAFLIIQ